MWHSKASIKVVFNLVICKLIFFLVFSIIFIQIWPSVNLLFQHIYSNIGQKGDYFYIIEKGDFKVLVNGCEVSVLEEGRSFGELALLYNTLRAATVRANSACVVFSLDRDTFRNTLANSSFSKVECSDHGCCSVLCCIELCYSALHCNVLVCLSCMIVQCMSGRVWKWLYCLLLFIFSIYA